MSQAVFNLPPSPSGWDDAAFPLIRIVDPRGGAIAWFSPDLGARCVGYAVRVAGEAWSHVLHTDTPDRILAGTEPNGCSIVAMLPERQEHQADLEAPPRISDVLPLHAWRFVERDPTAAAFETSFVPREVTPAGRPHSGEVRLRLAARLDDSALHLELTARNDGAAIVPIALGLRPVFAATLFGGQPVSVQVRTAERPFELKASEMGDVTIPGSRDGEERPKAYLVAPHHDVRVAVTLAAGIQHLGREEHELYPAVALTLLSDVPSAGLTGLRAGEHLRVAVTIRLQTGAADGTPDHSP